MASEDSDQFGPGLSAIHRLRDLSDLDQPVGCEMQAGIDERNANANFSKFSCLEDLIGYRMKNGMTVPSRSARLRTT